MTRRHLGWLSVFAAAVFAASPVGLAADVTSHLPKKALGFVVLRNLTDVSAKAETLFGKFDAPLPPLLTFFKQTTGFEEGFHEQGDILIALLPSQDGDTGEPGPLALVPVSDYGAFAKAQGGDVSGKIGDVTIAGESVLMAKQGDFALLMNPEYRAEMESVLNSGGAAPDAIAPTSAWLKSNDFSFVLLPDGIDLIHRLAKAQLKELEERLGDAGAPEQLEQLRQNLAIYEVFIDVLHAEARSVGIGWAIDDQENMKLGKRVQFKSGGQLEKLASVNVQPTNPMNALPAGPYAIAAGGPWPPEWTDSITQLAIDIARANPKFIAQAYGMEEMSEETQRKIVSAEIDVMSAVKSTAFCLRPVVDDDPFFGRFFGINVVDDADRYLASVKKASAELRKIISDAGGDTNMQPEMTEEEIAGKNGLKMVIDLAAAMGDDDNARGFIEMMFGGDAKLTTFVGVIDGNRVASLIGKKTPLVEAIEAIRAGAETLATDASLAKTKALMPSDAPWVAYVNPQGMVEWARGMIENVLGAFGGGLEIPDFPQTPPIGFSIQVTAGSMKADMIVPAETIGGLAEYIRTLNDR